MSSCDYEDCEDYVRDKSQIEKFNELFGKLRCSEEMEQRQIIEEMNEVMEEMNKEEFKTVFATKLFNNFSCTIKVRKIPMKNVFLFLKHIGYCRLMKFVDLNISENCLLYMRLEKMIVDEDKKREKKNENLMIELCESFLMLFCNSHSETIKRCVRFLLVVAMNKGENEDTKKEVEMALLALSCSSRSLTLGKNRYLDKIAEIIQYDQKHHNLTQLAQQSAWKFLVDRFYNEAKIVRELVKELHFAREATRELNELTKHVLGKKKESEWKKMKEALIIWGWVCTVKEAFFFVRSWKNEPNRLIRYLVRLCRAARETERDIFRKCIEAFIEVSQNRSVSIDVMIKEAAFDPLMEEIHQSTFSDAIMISIFRLFLTHFERLKEKEQDEAEKEKRKATKKMTFEKLEEEGYEDAIASFRGLFDFLNKKFRNYGSLSLDISKYFVYA